MSNIPTKTDCRELNKALRSMMSSGRNAVRAVLKLEKAVTDVSKRQHKLEKQAINKQAKAAKRALRKSK